MKKCQRYVYKNETTKWIRSFVTGRRQKVIINGAESGWGNVTSGVPQGSILGPIIFVLYINDLPEVINSHILLFADDTKIYKEVNDVNEQNCLQSDIDKMCKWSNDWLLKYHPGKCKSMRIGPPKDPEPFNYKINGYQIEKVEKEKDIGVTVDNKLNFSPHISEKVNKANSIMGLIRRSFTFLDQTIFTRLFKALVRPHIEYANTVWYPFTIKDKNLIENVQRRATKFLPCCANLEYDERLKKLDLPCLAYRKLRGDLIEVYKMLNGHYDEEVTPPLTKLRDVHDRQTRGGKHNLQKSKAKSNLRALSFRNRVVPFWNELSEKVKEAPSVKSFESRLDRFWKPYKIKFDFNKCLDFERRRRDPEYAGAGPRIIPRDNKLDLEIQAL